MSAPVPGPAAGPASGTSSEPPSSALRRVVAASMAGTVVEWYEFFLYATAATLVFGTLFFPESGSELDAIIAAFVTYAVGFVARPLGGIVFGHFGDKVGRKKLLQAFAFISAVNDRLFEGVGREEYRAVASFNAKFVRNTQATLGWIDRQPGGSGSSRAIDI